MKSKSLLRLVLLVLFSLFTGAQAWSQFTQGPPGNPSAAGIISGMPTPSIPVAPSPVTPPVLPRGAVGLVPMGLPEGGFGGAGSLAQYLGLSQDQVNKGLELRSRFYAETRELRYALSQKQLEMRKLFTDPTTDEATLLRK